MEEKITKQILWNSAAKAGLIFGIISISPMVINQLLAGTNPTLLMIVTNAIWLAKLLGCIFLMRYFFIKLCKKYPEATKKTTFGYGVRIALFSSILLSGYTLLNLTVISPELISEQFAVIRESMASMMDSNTAKILNSIEDKYVELSFFSNLIYPFIYGVVLSSILSSYVPKKDPFAEFKNNSQAEK